MVDTRYFETMGIPLVAGRDFTERDDATVPDVIVVNETLARRLVPDGQALGRRLIERDPMTGKQKPVEVVGVARDAKYIWPSERPRYFAYRPVRQIGQIGLGATHLIVHATGDPATISKEVRSTANAIDPDLSVERVTRLDELIERHVGETKLVIWASAAVGALALLLGAVGLYAVMAYAVAGRTKEIGIRMALGAGRGRHLRLHRQRHPDVRRLPDRRPEKLLGRDADDCEGGLVYRDGLAERGRVGAQPPLPPNVAHHGDRVPPGV